MSMGVLAGERYWRQAFNMGFLVEEGVIGAEGRELFWFAETARDIWDGILRSYEVEGETLFRIPGFYSLAGCQVL
ncbi:MAG: hypothetical protein ABI988_05345 [Nitrospirota bacterium]